MLADWCLREMGADPAADIRAQYSSVEEAQCFVGVSTLPQVFGRLFRSVGLKLTKSPAYGDVAMIKIGEMPVRGAIVATGYVVVGDAGIARVPKSAARLVAAWSVYA
ncbi:MAG: hypothetical protein JWN43_3431 [Gammaproteobacteria bacterium]|nr:hypothetical protein [Gammaproteobacteria bacterium]